MNTDSLIGLLKELDAAYEWMCPEDQGKAFSAAWERYLDAVKCSSILEPIMGDEGSAWHGFMAAWSKQFLKRESIDLKAAIKEYFSYLSRFGEPVKNWPAGITALHEAAVARAIKAATTQIEGDN